MITPIFIFFAAFPFAFGVFVEIPTSDSPFDPSKDGLEQPSRPAIDTFGFYIPQIFARDPAKGSKGSLMAKLDREINTSKKQSTAKNDTQSARPQKTRNASPKETKTAGSTNRKLCKNPRIRKSWYSLNDREKKAYLDAELCLQKLPAKTQSWHKGVKTRFDDLQAVHQTQSESIHFTGYFLPFHRLLLHAHETLLRQECGFNGAIPYWDEVVDAGKFSRAKIFDRTRGFGGSGAGKDKCIKDGPFAKYILHLGPGRRITDHCLARAIDDEHSNTSDAAHVNECIRLSRYDAAWPCIEGNPHVGGHFGVGGEMANAISSPGDPLFYLHHAFVDRVWWQWQRRNVEQRVKEISGFTTQRRPADGWKAVRMGDKLKMHGVIPDYTVAEVMDPLAEDGPFCYDYA